MNISKISLPTWYQRAPAAVEGLEEDQSGTDTKLPISQLRLKLRRNTEISEYNYVPSQSCCIANTRRKALQERATILFSSTAASRTVKG